jgi:aminopeptidase N
MGPDMGQYGPGTAIILRKPYSVIFGEKSHIYMKALLIAIVLGHCWLAGIAQKPGAQIDVLHYRFAIGINDDNDTIQGNAEVGLRVLRDSRSIILELVSPNESGKGMLVLEVKDSDRVISFRHIHDTLELNFDRLAKKGEVKKIHILYKGVPADGLIISTNKYNHRVFFADNWPNRAHNWLPCVDHPADKASVDFIIDAPEHYQIVSNGLLLEATNLPNHIKETHYQETVDLPTKVMVFGAADFAVNYPGIVDCIPISSWIYPEDREKGFYDYGIALEILPFFISHIGPYAYRKLANVQSKTMFGGMENASAIFYTESSVEGDRKSEALLTHEIAHQWFGNSATEKNWPHIWLSEGFATYMTHLYLEHKYGKDTLLKRMKTDRDQVIAFSKKRNTPVVDTSIHSQYIQFLNANSYQKGGWVLHMLRRRLGDLLFWKGIRLYYSRYAGHNADTEDFRGAMEDAGGVNLKPFFQQWLFTSGQPRLNVEWKYNENTKQLMISIEQEQNSLFDFPLKIAIESGNEISTQSVMVREKKTLFHFAVKTKPEKLVLDPEIDLLFEKTLKEIH